MIAAGGRVRAIMRPRKRLTIRIAERDRTMSRLLEDALRRVEGLPDGEKDAIATLILEELEDEARWERAFAHSQDALAKLAEEAMAEIE